MKILSIKKNVFKNMKDEDRFVCFLDDSSSLESYLSFLHELNLSIDDVELLEYNDEL